MGFMHSSQPTGWSGHTPLPIELLSRVFGPTCTCREVKSERYAFAAGKKTYGQKCRAIYREVLRSLLELSRQYLAAGKSCDEVLELLMPA